MNNTEIDNAAEALRIVDAARNVTVYMIRNPEWQAQFNLRPLWQQLLFTKLVFTSAIQGLRSELACSKFFVRFLQKDGLKQAMRRAGVMK